MNHLNQIEWIRIIVNNGRGVGHQRAAITLMTKLRQLGFQGKFDIWCEDKIGQDIYESDGRHYVNYEEMVGKRLKQMIPDFTSTKPDENGIRNLKNLGKLRVSSLPKDYKENQDLQKEFSVDLTITAADDFESLKKSSPEQTLKIFNTKNYVCFQPTDWQGYLSSQFIIQEKGKIINLTEKSRLSVENFYEKPDFNSLKDLLEIEEKILEITTNPNFLTQLVYGLYPSRELSIKNNENEKLWSPTGNLDEIIQVQRLIEALKKVKENQKIEKPIILFFPQKIVINDSFKKAFKDFYYIKFLDFKKESELNSEKFDSNKIFIVHVGALSQEIFDYLMLEGMSLPPVVEGCNSVENLEFNGRPFLHGSSFHWNPKEYDVKNKNLQNLHKKASRCLDDQEGSENLNDLIEYLTRFLNNDHELIEYHKDRQSKFLERPDVVKEALGNLEISYNPKNTKREKTNRKILNDNKTEEINNNVCNLIDYHKNLTFLLHNNCDKIENDHHSSLSRYNNSYSKGSPNIIHPILAIIILAIPLIYIIKFFYKKFTKKDNNRLDFLKCNEVCFYENKKN